MLLKKGTGPGYTYDLGVPRGSSSPDARRYLSVYLHIWFPSGDRLFSLFMISVSSQIVFDVFSSQDQTNALSPLNCMRFERVRKDSMGEPRSSSHIFLSSVVRKSLGRGPRTDHRCLPQTIRMFYKAARGFFPNHHTVHIVPSLSWSVTASCQTQSQNLQLLSCSTQIL